MKERKGGKRTVAVGCIAWLDVITSANAHISMLRVCHVKNDRSPRENILRLDGILPAVSAYLPAGAVNPAFGT